MFVLSNFFVALARLTDIILSLMYWLLLIRALISWVNPDPFNPIVQFLHRTTDPILRPLQRFIPPMGGFDISPLVAFVLIIFLKSFLVSTLYDIGMQLR